MLEEDGNVQLLIAGGDNITIQSPSFSPNGKNLAFVIFDQNNAITKNLGSDLYVTTRDKSSQLILEHVDSGEFYSTPRWSSDGRSLVYSHHMSTEDESGRPFLVHVEQIELSSREVKVLRRNARDPDLSPNNQMLIVVDDPSIAHRLVIKNLITDEERLLIDSSHGLTTFRVPQFSPDGEWVAFIASGEGPQVSRKDVISTKFVSQNGAQDLWLIRIDGSELQRITNLREDTPDFAWSANGKQVLMRGAFGIYIVDVAERHSVVLAPGEFHGSHDWISNWKSLPDESE